MDQNTHSHSPYLDTQEKALAINLDADKFGTFAEIGAGQEVARWFFLVGKASATVAKAISAYAMEISTDLYGPTEHYVSRGRLESMLDREWAHLIDRLSPVRGEKTQFFVFADTVATRGGSRKQDGQGWMGIRFQARPGAPFSQIIIHVNLLDHVPVSEKEAIGILGVNLIHAAFHQSQPEALMKSLLDGLSRLRVDIDMIKFSGPAFPGVDNRLVSLQIVQLGLTEATMFTAQGEVVQPAEVLYQKAVLIARGRFRPITNVGLDMLNGAVSRFAQALGAGPDPVVIMEITLRNLAAGPEATEIDARDFLDRADMLGALGKMVMVSSYTRFDNVTTSLRRYTQQWVGFAMGLPTLESIFDEQYYSELAGGILEGLGLLFHGKVRLYVYPTARRMGEVATSSTVEVAAPFQPLLNYLRERGQIVPIEDFDVSQLHVLPEEVLHAIQAGKPGWEQYLPTPAVEVIKRRALFGYKNRQNGES